MKKQIAAAISGGVDSLMAAFLLKNRGYRVTGLHFITGFESGWGEPFGGGDVPGDSLPDFSKIKNDAERRLAPIVEQLEIPVKVIDLRREFKASVVSYFIETYEKGQTPNPCLVCNPAIKFGTLLSHALDHGAEGLATGHYARIGKNADGTFSLFKGMDREKDQSYFLAFLNQGQLLKACFPLGGMAKTEVKALAEKHGLFPITEKESQDICFIGEKTYKQFLARAVDSRPGPIEDIHGNTLGEHQGLHRFTVGQRRGINCPAAAPYYVVRLDTDGNRLVVGFEKDLYRDRCRVEKINWIGKRPQAPIKVKTRIRYRHKAADSTVFPDADNQAAVLFDTPQAAITPGQGAVFYQDDQVLGGGWIV